MASERSIDLSRSADDDRRLSDMLLARARDAHDDGRDDDARMLAEVRWRLSQLDDDRPPDTQVTVYRHGIAMDRMRARLAVTLVGLLFVTIALGVLTGATGEEISQLAAPVSGLAGIAIGWMFSGGNARPPYDPDPSAGSE